MYALFLSLHFVLFTLFHFCNRFCLVEANRSRCLIMEGDAPFFCIARWGLVFRFCADFFAKRGFPNEEYAIAKSNSSFFLEWYISSFTLILAKRRYMNRYLHWCAVQSVHWYLVNAPSLQVFFFVSVFDASCFFFMSIATFNQLHRKISEIKI